MNNIDFETVYSVVKEEYKNGNIVKMLNGFDGPVRMNIENLLKQDTEGLLYDLGLDEAYLAGLHKESPMEFIEKTALANTIRYLHTFYKNNHLKST